MTTRSLAAIAPLALVAVAAAPTLGDVPQTRAGMYRNVTTVGGERYVVNECRAATPITVESAEGSCKATANRIGGGTINVALACPAGRSKAISGTYSVNGFTIRTVARGYGAAPTTVQVTSTRTGDCTPKE